MTIGMNTEVAAKLDAGFTPVLDNMETSDFSVIGYAKTKADALEIARKSFEGSGWTVTDIELRDREFGRFPARVAPCYVPVTVEDAE